uniref:Uncharacterized protein n=1 Tax=Arundo donax TaxID=35708 RepID=A0A0A9GWU3_ARUDO
MKERQRKQTSVVWSQVIAAYYSLLENGQSGKKSE